MLDLYAAALANRTIRLEDRLQHLRRLSDEKRGLRGSEFNERLHILIETLRRSDEAEIEIAVAETIRDVSDELTAEHVERIESILPQVETGVASTAIRETIKDREGQ